MLRTIELVENGEIMCSRCIGFIWRPQLRSRKKPIQQHQALRRIMEYFSHDVWRRPSSGQHGISRSLLRSSFCRFYLGKELLFIPAYFSSLNRI
jgi:hypothetical protein